MAHFRPLGVALATGALLAGCASPIVPTAPAPSATAGAPSPTAPSVSPARSAAGASPSQSARPSSSATASASPAPLALWLDASPDPAFAGDRVVLAVGAGLAGIPGVSAVTVDFGDGSSATTTSTCGAGPSIAHAYRRGGAFVARITAATPCDPAAGVDLSDASASVKIYPAAPASSAAWPACSTYDLHMGGGFTGAGLGNVETQVTLRNVGRRGCVVEGYPGVILLAANGSPMPTHATPGTTGAYMFPAVTPHRVALRPGDTATFMLGYTDNPFGASANEPYSVACPPSIAIRVILPGTRQFGTAAVPMGVCGGSLLVSPIVPGAQRIEFP